MRRFRKGRGSLGVGVGWRARVCARFVRFVLRAVAQRGCEKVVRCTDGV